MKKIITRYAPSPTGKLHIGGARTALFCYLYAKSLKGTFIVRLEDTDLERNIANGEQEQLDNLRWLGIVPDLYPGIKSEIGPFRQTERLEIYQKYAKELLDKKLAYKCYCTKEELEKSREEQLKKGITSPKYDRRCLYNPPKNVEGKNYSIRLYVPDDEEYSWNDLVRGTIKVPSNAIGDWVILKTNKLPTYNFANVIDDHLMEITDVFRGEEHIANTPKQIHLYQLLNWDLPNFSHNTIIIGEDHKKLSKRNENVEQFISSYRKHGFLPEAIFNYLAFLGWSSRNEREIYSKEELIKIFDIKGFSKSPSTFDYQKLQWLNNYYIKKLNSKQLYDFLNPFISNLELSKGEKERIFALFAPQLREGREIIDLINIFVRENIKNREKVHEVYLENKQLIDKLIDKLKVLTIWNKDEIKSLINDLGKELNLKGKSLMFPIRYIVTEKTMGPSIVEIMEIFGKEKVLKFLEGSKNE